MKLHDVVKKIEQLVDDNNVATIATKGCWYTGGLHSPFKHTAGVTRYNRDIPGSLLILALRKRGLSAVKYPGEEGFFTIIRV